MLQMKNAPCLLVILIAFTLIGCQKEYSLTNPTGTDSTNNSTLKKMSVYIVGNAADGDDTLGCTYYHYDAQGRVDKITDSSFNKDGARFSGGSSFTYNGASRYPVSAVMIEEDDASGFISSQITLEYNAANEITKESYSSTGETTTYSYEKNLVIVKKGMNKNTPERSSIDSVFYDDKHNITKEIGWVMESGKAVAKRVTTSTYTDYADPLHAFNFPPFNALQPANLALSSTDVTTDLSTGQNISQNMSYHYIVDNKNRVTTMMVDGTTGKITYEYY